jgi:hypothetical protein
MTETPTTLLDLWFGAYAQPARLRAERPGHERWEAEETMADAANLAQMVLRYALREACRRRAADGLLPPPPGEGATEEAELRARALATWLDAHRELAAWLDEEPGADEAETKDRVDEIAVSCRARVLRDLGDWEHEQGAPA